MAADQDRLTLRYRNVEIPVAWSTLSPEHFYRIALKYTDNREQLAAYRRETGLLVEEPSR